MRAARATIVVPALFALTLEVIGDLQMALFAVFGAFGPWCWPRSAGPGATS
jgi:hypothetical protein